MRNGPDIAATAALIGDPARAAMLSALMDGRALTATELAIEAGVTPQTASGHLARLEGGGLLLRARQGRHVYLRLASPDVAHVLEELMSLSHDVGPARVRPGPKDAALREARVCYNHMAGRWGVLLHDGLLRRGALVRTGDTLSATPGMADALRPLGLDPADLPGRSPLCRSCLDWSERRHHLAGRLGRALLARMEETGWVRRDAGSRALHLSAEGRTGLGRLVGMSGRDVMSLSERPKQDERTV